MTCVSSADRDRAPLLQSYAVLSARGPPPSMPSRTTAMAVAAIGVALSLALLTSATVADPGGRPDRGGSKANGTRATPTQRPRTTATRGAASEATSATTARRGGNGTTAAPVAVAAAACTGATNASYGMKARGKSAKFTFYNKVCG